MSQTMPNGQDGRPPDDAHRRRTGFTAKITCRDHPALMGTGEIDGVGTDAGRGGANGSMIRRPVLSGPASDSPTAQTAPIHRSIVAVDIVASTTRTNPMKARLRQVMYNLLDTALTRSGVAERHRDRTVDRGDGALVIVQPVDQVPKTLLINTFIPMLSALIDRHNTDLDEYTFRMRASMHAGEIHYDSRGPFGEALDIACRLVDAPELKQATRSTSAPLVLAVSDHIFQSVVRHRYSGIDDNAYQPLVRMDIGGREHRGWISVPDTTFLIH